MISIELFCVLLVGTVIMCIPIVIQMKWYSIAPWKSIIVSLALVLTGVVGSEIWYFIENLEFGGRSFYGAIFFVPLVFLPVAKLLRVSYGDILDVVAPAGCVTLALVKLQCMRDNCCLGKILYVDDNHMYVRFPSQIIEMVAFLLIAAIVFAISHNGKNRKMVFPWFLVIYGTTRFVLDFFRDIQSPYAIGLSAGSFWSLCAFVVGCFWLVLGYYFKKVKNLR